MYAFGTHGSCTVALLDWSMHPHIFHILHALLVALFRGECAEYANRLTKDKVETDFMELKGGFRGRSSEMMKDP